MLYYEFLRTYLSSNCNFVPFDPTYSYVLHPKPLVTSKLFSVSMSLTFLSLAFTYKLMVV